MHRHVVCLVALDQILRFFLRCTNRVALELHGGRNLFLDPSPDVAGFRVPLDMIANFEFVFHLRESGNPAEQDKPLSSEVLIVIPVLPASLEDPLFNVRTGDP